MTIFREMVALNSRENIGVDLACANADYSKRNATIASITRWLICP